MKIFLSNDAGMLCYRRLCREVVSVTPDRSIDSIDQPYMFVAAPRAAPRSSIVHLLCGVPRGSLLGP